ncbi:MAG: Trifunctional nucleotide phosphoesterase protein YfkN precursor [Lentisphaerae bacterium ADurb.BinA184]|nr:MAG: Trifunctional nucleotide phosphoesterase protein YfkN precursor [Lentisphaerae bacterium ADurb.BinA184]
MSKTIMLAVAVWGLSLLHTGLAAEVELTLLQTTDIHCYLERSDNLPAGGGWLRLSTLIEAERQRAGPGRCLLIDCGDSIQGTLEATATESRVAVGLLKAMRYDVWVPGNHDLDFGIERLLAAAAALEPGLLCGNLRLHPQGLPAGAEPAAEPTAVPAVSFPAWRLFERGGARVAVIGMTASYLDNWFWGPVRDGFRARSAVEAIGEAMPEVIARTPDMIVLAIHQGWLPNDTRAVNEVLEITRRFPEIDLIFGGHTHQVHPGTRVGSRAWYVQAGFHADYLAVVEARIDTEAHRVVDIVSKLVPASNEIAADARVRAAVAGELEAAAAFGRQRVGELSAVLKAGGSPGEDCPSSELISAALAEATGARVVVHGKLSELDTFAGPVTEAELFRLVPYENAVGVLSLTEAQLRAVIEEQLRNRGSYVACGLWGVVAHVRAKGQVVRLEMPDGAPLPERFTVAFNSYSLAGGGGRFPVLKELAGDSWRENARGGDSRSMLRAYLRAHSPYEPQTRRWLVRE